MRTYRDFGEKQLTIFKQEFAKRKILTVEECGIWLSLHPNIVRKYIKEGKIIAYKAFGGRSWSIDVEATKQNLLMKTFFAL